MKEWQNSEAPSFSSWLGKTVLKDPSSEATQMSFMKHFEGCGARLLDIFLLSAVFKLISLRSHRSLLFLSFCGRRLSLLLPRFFYDGNIISSRVKGHQWPFCQREFEEVRVSEVSDIPARAVGSAEICLWMQLLTPIVFLTKSRIKSLCF